MASLIAVDGKISFKLDTGETKNGKAVTRVVSLGKVNPDSPVADLSAVATKIDSLFDIPATEMTLRRVDLLVIA